MFKRPLSFYATRFHDQQENAWLGYKAGLDLVLPAGRRCISPEATVLTQDGPKEFGNICASDRLLSFDRRANQFRFSKSGFSFPKTKEIGFRVIHAQGEFVASAHHRVFCSDRVYRSVQEIMMLLSQGATGKAVSFVSPSYSISEPGLKSYSANGRHSIGKPEGSQDHCETYSHQCGQQLHQDLGTYQALSRPLSYAQGCARCGGQHEFYGIQGGWHHSLQAHSRPYRRHVQNSIAGVTDHGGFGQMVPLALPSCAQFAVPFQDQYQGSAQQYLGCEFERKCPVSEHTTSGNLLSPCVSHIVAVEQVSSQWFWDVQVPGDNNYVAGGAIHHNSGKTELICQIMIEDVETYGKPCLYVAKTIKQAREIVWEKFEQALRKHPDWTLYESSLEAYYKPEKTSIRIKGVDKDADNLTGTGYRIIACDEYALWKKPDVVGRVLAPMLGDYNGQFIFTSTKRGKNHFYKLHQKALSQPDKYYVGEWTMFENTYLTDEGRSKVLSEYEGGEDNLLYQQEVLNKYVVFEGQVFALPEEAYTERVWDPADIDHSVRWRCVDHGYSPDPTACLWMAYNPRKGYFQVYNEYKQHALLISQHSQAIGLIDSRSFQGSYSDVDPQVVAEYENVGLKLTNAVKGDKQARLLAVVNAMQSGRLKIASHLTKLRDELTQYVWDQDHNDDLVDSLTMLWASAQQRPEEYVKPEPEDYRHTRDQLDGHGQSFGD